MGTRELAGGLPNDARPKILDVDLGKTLGMSRPRNIRDLIGRLKKAGRLGDVDVRRTVRRTSMPHGGQRSTQVTEYLLTEAQAAIVAAASEAPNARAFTEDGLALLARGFDAADASDATAEEIAAVRPRTRGDCEDGPRPCPFVSCRHHLFLDVVSGGAEGLVLAWPGRELEDLPYTCSLDVADHEGTLLEDVGAVMNLTRERVRQLEGEALAKLRQDGALEDLYEDIAGQDEPEGMWGSMYEATGEEP